MQNDDHTSIRYLMKELDPAEAVLFEQRMMEDEDLLLEVECMRRTLRRLEKLPVKNPPSELTEYIVRKACSRNCSNTFRNWWIQQTDKSLTKYYAAAALILIGMGIGFMSFQYSDGEEVATQVGQTVSKADISRTPGLSINNEARSNHTNEGASLLNPAIDRDPGNGELLDSIHFNNLNPLVPRQHKRSEFMNTGSINLTGSQP